jgi:hypothetical protein
VKSPGRESCGPREAPDRGSVAADRSPWRSTSRCLELRRARHGQGRPAQPPHTPGSGRLRWSSSASRASHRVSYQRSPRPRRRRCGRRHPRQPRVTSRWGAGAPKLLRCRPPPGPCSSSQPWFVSSDSANEPEISNNQLALQSYYGAQAIIQI